MINRDAIIIPGWPAPPSIKALVTTRQAPTLPTTADSSSPFAHFNLALHVEDQRKAVLENRQKLKSLGIPSDIQWLNQVHGIEVKEARRDGELQTADAVFTREPDLACVVMTADCLPILMTNRQGSQVAAIHAGWRSLVDGVIENSVLTFDCAVNDLLIYLGPAISREHFEIGPEVREKFLENGAEISDAELNQMFIPSKRKRDHYYADIYMMAKARLAALGVSEIFGGNYCTYSETDRFYSYRRDGVTGRMASLIFLDPNQ